MKNKCPSLRISRTRSFEMFRTYTRLRLDPNDDGSYTSFGRAYEDPWIEVKRCIPASEIQPLLDRLITLRLPIVPEEIMGCDGDFTELKLGNSFTGVKLNWWSALPEGWEELDEITQALIDVSGTDI